MENINSDIERKGENPKEVKGAILEEEKSVKEPKTEHKQERKKEPRKRLTKEDKGDIKRRLLTGEKQRDIAKYYGKTEDWINKLAKGWNLQRQNLQENKQLVNVPQVQKEITKAATRVVQEEALVRFDDAVETGKTCIDKFRFTASLNGMELIEFLSKCVEFYKTYYGQVEWMREELNLQEEVIRLLIEKFEPAARELAKRREIQEAALLQMYLTGKVQEELLIAFLRT